MSVANKLLQAAAGNAGEAVYVDDLFSTFLYTGNGSARSITNGIDLAGEGGLIWTKTRGAGLGHALVDTENGVEKYIRSESDAQLKTDSNAQEGVKAFNSNGYNLGAWANEDRFNRTNYTYCSWTFRKQPKFFDVVTYSGTGSAQNISHNLGSVPGMIMVKRTSGVEDWIVYHRSTGNGKGTGLNQTNGTFTSTAYWNSTTPTDSVFTVGTHDRVNTSGHDYVAYLFAHDEQNFGENSNEAIIKCGSFTTDSSGDGSVNLGFEPQWILIKKTNSTGSWGIMDSMRGFTFQDTNKFLFANSSSAETDNSLWDIRNNGFNLNTGGANNTFMYVAIRRSHKPASEFAATDLFAIDTLGGTSPTPPAYVSGFPVDMELHKNVTGNGNWRNGARLMQGKYLEPNSTAVEGTDANMTAFDYQNGFRNATSTGSSKYAWMWRRAKGYFDVVAYTATGSIQTVNHNLGVTPEIMIVKDRDSTYGWGFWHKDLPDPDDEAIMLNTDAAKFSSTIFNKTLPTSTTFQVNYTSGAYIAYLFASVDGIAKVGSYTGTGSDVTVDCGFSAGARFVLIKRIDSTGDWYLYDSDRGIVAGNDPYVLINSNATNVTNTDYIDPDNSGFIVTSSAPAALNNSGGTYIFYAIA